MLYLYIFTIIVQYISVIMLILIAHTILNNKIKKTTLADRAILGI